MMAWAWSRNWLCFTSAVIMTSAPASAAIGMYSAPAPPHIATRFIVLSWAGIPEQRAICASLLDFTDEFYSRNRVGEISYNAEADFASAGFVATVVKSVRIRKTELFGKMP